MPNILDEGFSEKELDFSSEIKKTKIELSIFLFFALLIFLFTLLMFYKFLLEEWLSFKNSPGIGMGGMLFPIIPIPFVLEFLFVKLIFRTPLCPPVLKKLKIKEKVYEKIAEYIPIGKLSEGAVLYMFMWLFWMLMTLFVHLLQSNFNPTLDIDTALLISFPIFFTLRGVLLMRTLYRYILEEVVVYYSKK